MSPCSPDCIFIRLSSESGVQSLRILEAAVRLEPFLLIVCTQRIFTRSLRSDNRPLAARNDGGLMGGDGQRQKVF